MKIIYPLLACVGLAAISAADSPSATGYGPYVTQAEIDQAALANQAPTKNVLQPVKLDGPQDVSDGLPAVSGFEIAQADAAPTSPSDGSQASGCHGSTQPSASGCAGRVMYHRRGLLGIRGRLHSGRGLLGIRGRIADRIDRRQARRAARGCY